MREEIFELLIRRYIAGQATADECVLLEEYLRRLREDTNWQFPDHELQLSTTQVLERIRQKLQGRVRKRELYAMRTWKRYAAAAILTGTIVISVFNIAVNENKKTSKSSYSMMEEVYPGKEGAILTLGNGSMIIIDSASNGSLARLGDVEVFKSNDQLSFRQLEVGGSAEVRYNTLTTPRGNQYSNLTLSDGTRIWLDAESSIRFPTVFTGKARTVEITGQVWFDVQHNNEMPFVVLAKDREILDLGTQFNVNAYDDENELTVTLLEGVVQIGDVILNPGEQAEIESNGRMTITHDIRIDEVMAWKKGFFSFRDSDLKAIMRQMARWYDVEIEFEQGVSNIKFTGEIGRNLKLKEVLDGLEFANVKFKMEEGRKLVILR